MRANYTPKRIRLMRAERKLQKSKVAGVPDVVYQQRIGELVGAGHLRIPHEHSINISVTDDTTIGAKLYTTDIKIKQYVFDANLGERPHVTGYLASGHPDDPTFRIKGWFNEDGQLRIELVK